MWKVMVSYINCPGRPGIGGGLDVTSLPVVGTFDHSLSSGSRNF